MAEQQPATNCPICRQDTVATYKPFCSKRCADVDLNRWLNGSYVIAAQADDDEADSLPEGMDGVEGS